MPELTISDNSLAPLKDKVIVVTGCASGIGLAAVRELLKIGAKVIGGDITPDRPDIQSTDFVYAQGNVIVWKDLIKLFKTGIHEFGHIDHVFANAGITTRMKILTDEFDEDGELKRPDHTTFDVDLTSVIDTLKLGIHHIRKNSNGGGSVVATLSASSFQRFPAYDYSAAKAGVHGFLRGMFSQIGPATDIPVQFNGIAPSWTLTGFLNEAISKQAGLHLQGPEIAARSALLLMADNARHGEVIFSQHGKYFEIESHLLEATENILKSAPSMHPRIRDEAADAQALFAAYAG